VVEQKNGKAKLINMLAMWLFIIITSVFGITVTIGWASIVDNRKNITQIKDCISADMKEVLQRLTRMEAKMGQ